MPRDARRVPLATFGCGRAPRPFVWRCRRGADSSSEPSLGSASSLVLTAWCEPLFAAARQNSKRPAWQRRERQTAITRTNTRKKTEMATSGSSLCRPMLASIPFSTSTSRGSTTLPNIGSVWPTSDSCGSAICAVSSNCTGVSVAAFIPPAV
eukprot:scaffold103102_cov63-Phaeocystis_antarctica.AAC.3